MGTLADDLRRCMRMPADNSAWESFIECHKRLLAGIVYRVARRFGVERLDEIDDAVQEVCVRIISYVAQDRLPEFEDPSFEAYVKALVANAAHDYFRARRAKKRDMMASQTLDFDLPNQIPASMGIESEALLNQLENLAGKDSRTRQVFRLYYRLGWTAKEIAGIECLGLSAKGVESLVFRLTSDLRQKVQARGIDSAGGKETSSRST